MNCERFADRLDALLDGDLPPHARDSLHAHAAGCPACSEELEAALALKARLAALPAEVTPVRDLWPGIAAGISACGHRRGPRTPLMAIAAGTGALAVAAVLVVQLYEPPTPAAVAATSDRINVSVDPGLQLASQSMLDAAEDHGAGELSPETLAVVRENLDLIDHALREIAVALELDPDNPQLQRQLLDTYRGQVRLLDYLGRVGTQPTARMDI